MRASGGRPLEAGVDWSRYQRLPSPGSRCIPNESWQPWCAVESRCSSQISPRTEDAVIDHQLGQIVNRSKDSLAIRFTSAEALLACWRFSCGCIQIKARWTG